MAEVWLAVDAELERQVVVKLLAPDADRERFEREARAVAGLSHPNIVQLFDFGEEERWFMVFEYLPRGSLEQRLAETDVLPGDEVARVARDVAAGLAYAHDRGVVHRDLKPANVLFDPEDRSKIADFGIARVQGIDTLTDPGTVLGTAAYISPEQVRGESATPATDVYSFGVILYRLLAGRLPFEADSATQLAALHRDAEPPRLQTNDELSRVLAAVAMAALAKEPSRRPVDGTALARALEDRTLPVAATTNVLGAPGPPTSDTRRRVPLIAGLAAAVGLAGCGAVAAMLLTDTPPPAPAVTGRPPTHPVATRARSAVQTATARHSSPDRTRTAPTVTAGRTTTPQTTRRAPPITAITTTPPTTTPPSTQVTTAPATTATTTPATTPPTTAAP